MSRRAKSVILLSGGLDSAANLAFCSEFDEPALALTADYGQRAARAEWAAAEKLCRYYGVRHERLDLRWLGALGGNSLTDPSIEIPSLKQDQLDDLAITRRTAPAVWVPNRNGVLINAAASFAERLGAERVVVGFNREEAATFPDNSMEYLDRATRALAMSTAIGVRVFCYTGEWDKRRIALELKGLSRAFPFESIWSCYFEGPEPCGACESCQRGKRAMAP